MKATDCEGLDATSGFIAHRDNGAPVINSLQPAPAINEVVQTPYRLTGTISDRSLAGLTIANQSVVAQPTGTPGQWSFMVDVPLQRQLDWPLTIEAWDAAGLRSRHDVVLRLGTAWCANSGSGSGGISEVVVEYAAEPFSAQDSAARGCRCIGGCSDKLVAEALMVSFGMIVSDILLKELPEVSLAEWNDTVQAFTSDRVDEALRVGIQVRTPRWQPDATHTGGPEHLTEGARVQRVPIQDDVAMLEEAAVDSVSQVPRDLLHPCAVRLVHDAGDLNTSRCEVDDEQQESARF